MIPAAGLPPITDFGVLIRQNAVRFGEIFLNGHRIIGQIAMREGDSPMGVTQAIARNVMGMARAWSANV